MDPDQPYIDFDGDGESDSYVTEDLDSGGHQFTHYDADGDASAIAYDYDGDGLIDAIDMDHGNTGQMTHHYEDTDGDGWMDTEEVIASSGDEGDGEEGDGEEGDPGDLPSDLFNNGIGLPMDYSGSSDNFLTQA